MTFEHYLKLTEEVIKNYPQLRPGQVYYNSLPSHMMVEITKQNLSPYYDETKIGAFIQYICLHWKDKP